VLLWQQEQLSLQLPQQLEELELELIEQISQVLDELELDEDDVPH
jgi:hypothetical protein